MQRRKFIQYAASLAGGLVITSQLPASMLAGNEKKLKGRVLSGGKGIKGVVVSDGYNVVVTDKDGKYSFQLHPDANAVFVSTPGGYAFANEKGISRHYYLRQDIHSKKSIDFELVRLDKDDTNHQFIIWADPQVKNASDVQKMMNESVPDVQKFVTAAGAGTLLHGITVGDIVWDEHKLYPEYNKAVENMGIPFFQCLGNHDMDYTNGSDESSDDTFTQTYGPTYYSFNRGQVHYVVLDDVRYLGKDREYDGYISQNQLDWLKKDLEFVPKQNLIILCLHIPVHSGVKNNSELYPILEDRNVHIMSGHTHYLRNVIKGNVYEHNHGTVCGAWWTGPICEDGTPNGYGIYSVKGTQLEWHYQSTGKLPEHQLQIFIKDQGDNKNAVVNIWNYDAEWKAEYWIDDAHKGTLLQAPGLDPLAEATLLGPDLPKPRGFAEPEKTDHLFKALIPADAKEIRVVATDRFGKKYTATQALVA
ncbi:MAG TPA: calcineurin-like phosphoesterase family protein [Chitinophagaceae bacterium]|nr:calcineurin-like phosphoesterase family protein [Chitinophagaceae bacterium]